MGGPGNPILPAPSPRRGTRATPIGVSPNLAIRGRALSPRGAGRSESLGVPATGGSVARGGAQPPEWGTRSVLLSARTRVPRAPVALARPAYARGPGLRRRGAIPAPAVYPHRSRSPNT